MVCVHFLTVCPLISFRFGRVGGFLVGQLAKSVQLWPTLVQKRHTADPKRLRALQALPAKPQHYSCGW